MLENSLGFDLHQIINKSRVEISWFDPFFNPRVTQSFSCCHSSLQVWVQQQLNEIFNFIAEAIPILIFKMVVTATNFRVQFVAVGRVERGLTG
jgi:hypothetical protein